MTSKIHLKTAPCEPSLTHGQPPPSPQKHARLFKKTGFLRGPHLFVCARVPIVVVAMAVAQSPDCATVICMALPHGKARCQ